MGASQGALVVKKKKKKTTKNQKPGLQMLETLRGARVWSLDLEDPLEEDMAAHSSIFAWRAPWTEEPGGPRSIGFQRVGHDWSYSVHMHALSVEGKHSLGGVESGRHCPNQLSLKQDGVVTWASSKW